MKLNPFWSWAFLASALQAPLSAAVDIAADNPFIQYSGRFDRTDAKKPRCDWPGSSIQARFTGTSITVKISGGMNDFNVIVDGVWKSKLTVDGKTSQVAAQGLLDGAHEILLTKRTEGFQGITTFEGFQLEDGKAMVAPPPKAVSPKIQFIGDSYTVGYGDEANVLSCPDRRPYDNNYLAYGPVTARAVGADYSVQAVSGLGMVHNYGDASPVSARPMPSYFGNTLFGVDDLKWDFTKWIPDLVVVALGTNDFSTAVKPTEAQYASAYKDFLKKVRAWYPNAEILCMTYSVDAYQKKYVDTLVSQVAAAGDAKIHRVHMPALVAGELGCDYHPNVAGQRKYADALIPQVKHYLGITGIGKPMRPIGKPMGTGEAMPRDRSGAGETQVIPYRPASGPAAGPWVDARGRLLAF
ncbi:MAG: Esterase, hydrolase-type [Fibrobacteres bacterium]|nr:Esterase, hydrolase-type [Fibrobacterota bacterium]